MRLPVSFIHRCTESRLCAGNVIYRVEPGLVQRVEKDFGERAPLLLRQVQLAVNAALATGEGDPLATRVPGGLLSACLRSIQRRLHYRLQPWVDLPEELEHRLSRLADHYNRRTGQDLVITSGRRTAEAQAAAMYAKLERGVGLLRTYRKRRLAQELRRAFSSARRAGFSPRRIVASLVQAIQRQMQEGAFISAHLRGRAVDIRSRDMSRAHKRALRRAVSSMGGMRLIREERIPPHFHLDIRPEL